MSLYVVVKLSFEMNFHQKVIILKSVVYENIRKLLKLIRVLWSLLSKIKLNLNFVSNATKVDVLLLLLLSDQYLVQIYFLLQFNMKLWVCLCLSRRTNSQNRFLINTNASLSHPHDDAFSVYANLITYLTKTCEHPSCLSLLLLQRAEGSL